MAKKYSKEKRTYKTRRLYKILTRRFRGAGSPLGPNARTNPKKMTKTTQKQMGIIEEKMRKNVKDNKYIAKERTQNAIKKEEERLRKMLDYSGVKNVSSENKFKPQLNTFYEEEDEQFDYLY